MEACLLPQKDDTIHIIGSPSLPSRSVFRSCYLENEARSRKCGKGVSSFERNAEWPEMRAASRPHSDLRLRKDMIFGHLSLLAK